MITVNFYVDKVGVLPSANVLPNVIKYVKWVAIYELDGNKSVVPGEAFLLDPNPEKFMPIETISDQQVIDWAIASHGGQPFLDELLSFQKMRLEQKALVKATTLWTTPLLSPKTWDASFANEIPVTVI